jgi:hypothetical protein
MDDQSSLMKAGENELETSMNSEGMSPELIGAGAIAAVVATVAGVSTATNMDVRYVDLGYSCILYWFLANY